MLLVYYAPPLKLTLVWTKLYTRLHDGLGNCVVLTQCRCLGVRNIVPPSYWHSDGRGHSPTSARNPRLKQLSLLLMNSKLGIQHKHVGMILTFTLCTVSYVVTELPLYENVNNMGPLLVVSPLCIVRSAFRPWTIAAILVILPWLRGRIVNVNRI